MAGDQKSTKLCFRRTLMSSLVSLFDVLKNLSGMTGTSGSDARRMVERPDFLEGRLLKEDTEDNALDGVRDESGDMSGVSNKVGRVSLEVVEAVLVEIVWFREL